MKILLYSFSSILYCWVAFLPEIRSIKLRVDVSNIRPNSLFNCLVFLTKRHACQYQMMIRMILRLKFVINLSYWDNSSIFCFIQINQLTHSMKQSSSLWLARWWSTWCLSYLQRSTWWIVGWAMMRWLKDSKMRCDHLQMWGFHLQMNTVMRSSGFHLKNYHLVMNFVYWLQQLIVLWLTSFNCLIRWLEPLNLNKFELWETNLIKKCRDFELIICKNIEIMIVDY